MGVGIHARLVPLAAKTLNNRFVILTIFYHPGSRTDKFAGYPLISGRSLHQISLTTNSPAGLDAGDR
jgi:hypothetical protein